MSDVSGDEEVYGDGAALCFLCCKPGNLCCFYGCMVFDKHCKSAVDSLIRQVKRGAGDDKEDRKRALAKDKQLMTAKPMEWRQKVNAHASDDKAEAGERHLAIRAQEKLVRQSSVVAVRREVRTTSAAAASASAAAAAAVLVGPSPLLLLLATTTTTVTQP